MDLLTQTFQQYQIRPIIPVDGIVYAQFTDESEDMREGMEVLVFDEAA